MTHTVGSKVRRLLMASGVALVLGVPTLACMGGGDTSGGDATDGTTKEEPAPKEEKGALKDDLVGTWKVQPSEEALRELKIIRNAIEGKPPPKKLQPLSDAEPLVLLVQYPVKQDRQQIDRRLRRIAGIH